MVPADFNNLAKARSRVLIQVVAAMTVVTALLAGLPPFSAVGAKARSAVGATGACFVASVADGAWLSAISICGVAAMEARD